MKLVKRIFGGLLVVVCLAAATIFVLSNSYINKRYAFKEYPVAVLTDSASLAHGERWVRMRCAGCHGEGLRGNVFFDEPNVARLIAPNVPAKLKTLTDAEFAGFLRSGVRKDGTSPFVMPPPGYYHISDADLGALIGYLRSMPVIDNPLPANSYRAMGRFGIALGQFKTSVASFDTTMDRVGQDPAWSTTRHGEYIARMICTECHGLRLTGDSAAAGGDARTPSLAGAVGYSPEQFVTLLRTGTPRDSTTRLTLMADMARESLKYLTDDEISAVYNYIKGLPTTGVR
jgi:mono/diheme cytochrome c family protein